MVNVSLNSQFDFNAPVLSLNIFQIFSMSLENVDLKNSTSDRLCSNYVVCDLCDVRIKLNLI